MTLQDIPANRAATWIRDNTPPSAVFLNSSYFFHPASIAGRKIFMGWPYFTWSAGYISSDRYSVMKTVYESDNKSLFCPLLQENNISYITVEHINNDPNLPAIDVRYFTDNFTPVYSGVQDDRDYYIFSTSSLCSE